MADSTNELELLLTKATRDDPETLVELQRWLERALSPIVRRALSGKAFRSEAAELIHAAIHRGCSQARELELQQLIDVFSRSILDRLLDQLDTRTFAQQTGRETVRTG